MTKTQQNVPHAKQISWALLAVFLLDRGKIYMKGNLWRAAVL